MFLKFCLFLSIFFQGISYGTEAEPCYEVKIDYHDILCVNSIGSMTAESRGKLIEERIERISEDKDFDIKNLKIEKSATSYLIMANGLPVITLPFEEFSSESSIGGDEYARIVLDKLKFAIETYRKEHKLESILLGVLYSLIATIFFVIFFKASNKIHALLAKKLNPLILKVTDKTKISSYNLMSVDKTWKLVETSLFALLNIIRGLLVYFYLTLVLSFFPWTVGFAPKILHYVLDPLYVLSRMVFDYIPNIFFIIVIVLATRYFIKLVKVIFNAIESGSINISGFHKELAAPTFKLLKGLIYALSLVMIFPYLPGSSSPAFQGLSVFLGVVISFSSGSAIANMIAGVVITYMRPFKIGDRVKISDTQGEVVERNFLVTRIKTSKNTDVTIPNTMVLGTHIHNFSSNAKNGGIILYVKVEVGFDVDWRLVHTILKEASLKTNDIDRSKEPFIVQAGLGEAAVSYELNVYTEHAEKMNAIYSELYAHVLDGFKEKGIDLTGVSYHQIVKE